MRRPSKAVLRTKSSLHQSFYKQSRYKQQQQQQQQVEEEDDVDDSEGNIDRNDDKLDYIDVKEVEDENDISFTFDQVDGKLEFSFRNENPSLAQSAKDDRRVSVVDSVVEMKNQRKSNTKVAFEEYSECSSSTSDIGSKKTNHQFVTRLSGCKDTVLTLSYHQSGGGIVSKIIISSCSDGSIVVWHAIMNTVLYYLTGHVQPIHALVVTPKHEMSGDYLVSGCDGGKIIVWDLDTGLQVRNIGIDSDRIGEKGVSCMTIRKHSQCKDTLLIVGYSTGNIHIWDFVNGTLIFSLQGHQNLVTAISIVEKKSQRAEKGDDFFIVSSSLDKVIHVYDLQEQGTSVTEKILHMYYSKINSYRSREKKNSKKSSKTNKSFYHVADDGTLDENDEEGKLLEPLRKFTGHEGGVRKFIVRPKQSSRNCGHYIISCGDDCTVRYWDVECNAEVRVLRGHSRRVSDMCIREITLSASCLANLGVHQSFLLITASLDRTVVIWDGISGEALRCLQGHHSEVYSLCLVEKDFGKFNIVSGASNGDVIVWNIDCQHDINTVKLTKKSQSLSMEHISSRDIDAAGIAMSLDSKVLISTCHRELNVDDISAKDDFMDDSLYSYVTCNYGSSSIQVYEGEGGQKVLKVCREFSVTPETSDNFDNDPPSERLHVTSLATMSSKHLRISADCDFFIVVGFSNGDVNLMLNSDGRVVKSLKEDLSNDESQDLLEQNSSVIGICPCSSALGDGKEKSFQSHILFSCGDGTVMIWDVNSGIVINCFRDYEENISSLAVLDINFALLDSLVDGGIRYSMMKGQKNDFDYGIVTGSMVGVIKVWKYNIIGDGWVQCFEISTSIEDPHHGGCGISSLGVLCNDFSIDGQTSPIRNLGHFFLVAGYVDGSVNIWDIEGKCIVMMLEEKHAKDLSYQGMNFEYAVTDVSVSKKHNGYEIVCGRCDRIMRIWNNIDINNVPGYGILRDLLERKCWFSLHVLYKRFGWMLFNAWQSNAESLFTFTLLKLKNRQISSMIKKICMYNSCDSNSDYMYAESVSNRFTPSYSWLGVRTTHHEQSLLRTCVERRVYDDIKFTLEAWCNVLNSADIDLFDELHDSFHYQLTQEDLILVAEEFSPLFCEFLMKLSSQKSNQWIMGSRVRDQFHKRDNFMKMKSFDKWYQKKYLDSSKKNNANMQEGGVSDDENSFWDSNKNANENSYLDIVQTEGLSIDEIYERFERETEYRLSLAKDAPTSGIQQTAVANFMQGIRSRLGDTMEKRKARHQVLIEGRFMPLRNTLCRDLVFLRACLATENVEIFDTEILNLTVDYAWRAYGRRGHSQHFVSYIMFLLFAALATFNFETLMQRENMPFSVVSPYSVAMALQIVLGIWLIFLFYLELVAVLSDAATHNIIEALIFYFGDVWNTVDLTSYTFNSIGVIIRLTTEKDTNFSKIAFAISSLFMWLKLLYYLRAFRSTGPLVSMILQILFESRYFLSILCIALFGFAQAFVVLDLYGTVGTSLLQVFVMMLGEIDQDFQNSINPPITTIFFSMFMVVVTVVFLNLLIAIMGDSYDRIKEKEIAQWRRQQAKSIVDETLVISEGRKNKKDYTWFPMTIHFLRPLDKSTDADDSTEWQGKITQLKRTIAEANDDVKKEAGKHSNRIDALGLKIHGIDEVTKQMESKLTQKVEVLTGRVNDLMSKMDVVLEKLQK